MSHRSSTLSLGSLNKSSSIKYSVSHIYTNQLPNSNKNNIC